jgi:hypothetical protein
MLHAGNRQGRLAASTILARKGFLFLQIEYGFSKTRPSTAPVLGLLYASQTIQLTASFHAELYKLVPQEKHEHTVVIFKRLKYSKTIQKERKIVSKKIDYRKDFKQLYLPQTLPENSITSPACY